MSLGETIAYMFLSAFLAGLVTLVLALVGQGASWGEFFALYAVVFTLGEISGSIN